MEEYIVQQGDSYWAIAKRLGIDPVELLRMNGLTMADAYDRGALYVGDSIKVPPQPVTTQTVASDTGEYIAEDWDAPTDDFDWVAPTGPVQDLITEPAYAAFLGQYNMDVGQIEQTRIMESALLQGNMQTQLGKLTEEGANPYSETSARTGGLYEVGRERQQEASANVFAGKGMAHSGGRWKQEAEIGTDWASQEEQYWNKVRGERQGIDQGYMDRRRQLELEKLAEESSAYQRRVVEDITAQYG